MKEREEVWEVPITLNGSAIGVARFTEREDIEAGFIKADCVLAPAIVIEKEVDGRITAGKVVALNMFPACMHTAIAGGRKYAKEEGVTTEESLKNRESILRAFRITACAEKDTSILARDIIAVVDAALGKD